MKQGLGIEDGLVRVRILVRNSGFRNADYRNISIRVYKECFRAVQSMYKN